MIVRVYKRKPSGFVRGFIAGVLVMSLIFGYAIAWS